MWNGPVIIPILNAGLVLRSVMSVNTSSYAAWKVCTIYTDGGWEGDKGVEEGRIWTLIGTQLTCNCSEGGGKGDDDERACFGYVVHKHGLSKMLSYWTMKTFNK